MKNFGWNKKYVYAFISQSHKHSHRESEREREKDSVSANTLFGWFIACILWIAVVASFPPASTLLISACAQNELMICRNPAATLLQNIFFSLHFSLVYNAVGSNVRFLSSSHSLFCSIIFYSVNFSEVHSVTF